MQAGSGKIFGTPPEPLFNVKPHLMSEQLLEEWLERMRDENDRRMDQPTKLQSQVCVCLCDVKSPTLKFVVFLFNKKEYIL